MSSALVLLAQTCAYCQAVFQRQRSQRYCSHRCEGASRRRPLAERFWARVIKTRTCWLWTGALNKPKGYGVIGIPEDGKTHNVYVHRLSWELHHGLILPGFDVCHRCDISLCVRPTHLFLGTRQMNMADAKAKGRIRSGPEWQEFCRTIAARGAQHGSRTHPERWPRGERIGTAKLTEVDVMLIRTMRYRFPPEEIGAFFRISPKTVHKIWHGDRWAHVA